MKIELLQALIAAWPAQEAVRLCDGENTIIAQNAASLLGDGATKTNNPHDKPASTWMSNFWHGPEVRTLQLVDRWCLQTRPVDVDLLPVAIIDEPLPERPVEVQALARGVAHELRNPLAAIVTAAGLLQDDENASEETLLLLNVIRKESRRMNRILTEFAAYVKPRPAQVEAFDAALIVREEVRSTLQNLSSEDANFEIEDEMADSLSVYVDIEQFREVIVQILHNTREALPHGGRVHLQSRLEADKVVIAITDNGSGLSAEAVKNAFQPFFSSKSHSTGLGLSVARSAIEASGGRIWLENLSDVSDAKGVRVSLELPTVSP